MKIELPPGLIAVTSYGVVQLETVRAITEMARHLERHGMQGATFDFVHGNLVDKARNEAVAHMLANQNAQWIWMLDADMVWSPDIALGVWDAADDINGRNIAGFRKQGILTTAYATSPWADVVGGYCNLRGGTRLPTIDTGTGTWESHGPNKGTVEVMRTGTACLLIKRHVFEQMPYPWFGTRDTPRIIDAITEVDNYCHQKFDCTNPFREKLREYWEPMLQMAHADSLPKAGQPRHVQMGVVGEDSNFCDRAKAMGFRIAVQTDAVCHHIEKKIIGPDDHFEAMQQRGREERAWAGITK